MQACGTCGRPRTPGNRHCTGCGTRFPDGEATPLPGGEAGRPPHNPKSRDRTSRRAVFGLALALVVAGAATGAWILVAHSGANASSRGKYFDDINAHNYSAYAALLAPGMQAPSSSQFASGYGSTSDTDESLRGLSAGSGGEVVARVTFTSHQEPAESPTGTNCDRWAISLYLVPESGGYQIGKPASGYHASYAYCS